MPILGSPLWMVPRSTGPKELMVYVRGEQKNERTTGDRMHELVPEWAAQTECSVDLPREAGPSGNTS